MRVRIGNRTFAPRWWGALAAGAVIAAALSLANWQLGRAREKQALIDAFDRGLASSTVLDGGSVDALPRYRHVSVRGRYDPAHQVLIDNVPSSTGNAGYRVLTPLLREGGGRALLVDRGWVPLGLSRAQVPDVAVDAEPRTLAGRLDTLPVPGIRVGAADTPGDTQWPRVLLFPTATDLAEVLGQPVEARILLLDADQPDGYERVWRPALEFPPERHLGYALQWLALAVAALVAFIALSLERDPASESTRP